MKTIPSYSKECVPSVVLVRLGNHSFAQRAAGWHSAFLPSWYVTRSSDSLSTKAVTVACIASLFVQCVGSQTRLYPAMRWPLSTTQHSHLPRLIARGPVGYFVRV